MLLSMTTRPTLLACTSFKPGTYCVPFFNLLPQIVSCLAFLAPLDSVQMYPPAKAFVGLAEGHPPVCSLHSGHFPPQLLPHELHLLAASLPGPRKCGLHEGRNLSCSVLDTWGFEQCLGTGGSQMVGCPSTRQSHSYPKALFMDLEAQAWVRVQR